MEDTPSPALMILVLMMLTAMAFSFLTWAKLIFTHRRDLLSLPSRLVPAQPRQRPFWHPGDALLMFGLVQVLAGFAVATLMVTGAVASSTTERTPAGALMLIGVTLGAGAVASVLTIAWLRFRDQRAIDKLSLRLNDSDGLLGIKAAVMILPPVLILSALASRFVQYEHPVLTSMEGLKDPLMFSLIFIGTAIVTPFVEELMFRVLLQGGLERLFDSAPALPQTENLEASTAIEGEQGNGAHATLGATLACPNFDLQRRVRVDAPRTRRRPDPAVLSVARSRFLVPANRQHHRSDDRPHGAKRHHDRHGRCAGDDVSRLGSADYEFPATGFLRRSLPGVPHCLECRFASDRSTPQK